MYSFHKQNRPNDHTWEDYSMLRDAVRCSDIYLVKRLIDNGAPVNQICLSYSEHSPLHLAVISRKLDIVKILLDHGADINSPALSESSLTLAAKTNNTDIVDLLLSYDVQKYENFVDHLSHLHVACMRNKLDVVKKLLYTDHGEKIGDPINKAVSTRSIFWPDFTPLHFAVYYGCIETVEYLLKCGADIMKKDSRNLTPLHWADIQRNEKIIDLLLSAHAYEFRNPTGPHGMTHFHIACTRNNPLVVTHFLKSGVDIDCQVQHSGHYYTTFNQWQPIHLAIYYECPAVIELLLKMEANLKHSVYEPEEVILEYAFLARNDTIYNLLIRRTEIERSQNPKTSENISDILLACSSDDSEVMEKWLLDNRNAPFDLDLPMWEDYTLLHLAARHNSVKVSKLLLAYGANFATQDPYGKTPFHVAFEFNRLEIIHEIINNFTESTENIADKAGLSFLHILCSTNELKAIEKFLKRGVDVMARVGIQSALWAGFTPMQFAYKFEKKDVVMLLLKYNADILIENGSIFEHFYKVLEDSFLAWPWGQFQNVLCDILVKVLSSPSLKVKYSNDSGILPLHALCMSGDCNLKLLMEYVALHPNQINQTIERPQSRKYHKSTPLHLAVQSHRYKKARFLISVGADPIMINSAGETPMEAAFSDTFASMMVSNNTSNNLFPHELTSHSLRPSHFFIACVSEKIEFVSHVLQNIEDLDLKKRLLECRNDAKQTSLHFLAKNPKYDQISSLDDSNRRNMILLLLENGADANAIDYELKNPLYDEKVAKVSSLFIQYGANVNIQNMYGETPLHTTCNEYGLSPAKLIVLLNNGADINIEDEQGQTCLTILNTIRRSTYNYDRDSNDDDDDDYGDGGDNPTTLTTYALHILKHVMAIQSIGHNISEKNRHAFHQLLARFRQVFNTSAFKNECNKELESMKLKNIDPYNTVRDILSKTSNQMAHHCENDVLKNMFESNFVDFPIFNYLLRLQMKRGQVKRPLLESFRKSLTLLFGTTLPRSCLEIILNYLTDADLTNIIKSRER